MPCLYPTTAITALRTLVPSAKWAQQGFLRHSTRPRVASTLLKRTDASTSPKKSIEIPTTYTPAQTSRAARKAVVLALQSPIGGVQDALYIVNSLHQPILKQNPQAAHLPNVSKYSGITFNRTINPRLASHTLVHTLIRRNRAGHAADLAVSMMECGMRVRGRTLNIVMGNLENGAKAGAKNVKATPPPTFSPYPQSLGDLAGLAQHPTSRLAVQIFTVARRTGQGNTSGLFGTLLAICLINTEIVLACFVFAMTVKEFYHPPPCPEGDTSSSTWNTKKYGPRSLVFLPSWSNLIDLTTPMKNYFERVATLTTTSPRFDQDTLNANLQALAILANLLDLRQLHLPTISSLLALLYSTPRVDSTVWVLDGHGNSREVIAYAYFHDVLVRLIESPPGIRGNYKKSTRAQTPPLGLKPANTLLHYALRHCHSPTLGNKVLVHLTQARKLTPDATTYNILLRSGTLLRDDDLASLAVTAMTNQKENQSQASNRSKPNHIRKKDDDKTADPDLKPALQALSRSESKEARYIASLIETVHSFNVWAPNRNRLVNLRTCLYSLTTHIMHMCSTGRPHLAKVITFALFPVLGLRGEERTTHHTAAVVRAAYYGPVTFTVLLNALIKARLFSEARALYYLASAAEERSWVSPEPWTLGTEVYTLMLELCAGESTDAAHLERNAKSQADRIEATEMRAKALRMALRQYKKMKKLRYTASNAMRESGNGKNWHKLTFPRPDERLATALIKVLVLHFKYVDPAHLPVPDIKHRHRQPHLHTQSKISMASVSRTFEQTRRQLVERGVLAEGWTEALQFIACGIVKAEMDVPPALRHLFLGRYEAAARTQGRGVPLRVVPWAYPAERSSDAWHPWVVPSLRTRGLVTRRVTRAETKRKRIYRLRMMRRTQRKC
ncbi:hypothetical protein H0H87_002198 [Tephrocybe sp. NHM501043]|nr:hypothetical protein H0H87_002198 [Tephrocybe sp. NHM501043]